MPFIKGHKTNVGRKASLEKRKKISEGNKGRIHGEKLMSILKARKGKNNPMFGRKQTEKAKEKVRIHKLAEKNPNWKGDKVRGKDMYHEWLRRRYPAPKLCENCHKEKKLQLANIKNHVYTRKIEDYKWLCSKCHYNLDRRKFTI
jgi:hypothetical protein